MSNFQFELPVDNSDLLNTSGNNYYVKHVYSGAEITEKLKTCKQKMYLGDPFYIFDHFDTYFTIIEGSGVSEATALTNLMRSFDLLYVTVDKMGERLSSFLGGASDEHGRDEYLNLLKMTMYLQVSTVKKIDAIVHNLQQQQFHQKKRGKGTAAPSLEQFPDWETKRGKFLVQLYNVMQFPLEKLWMPPVVEENFINLLCDVCYRTLEVLQPRPDMRHLGDTIFQILGTAIKRYNHALTFPVRILQLLRTVERSALVIASGVHLLHEEYAITSVFAILVKDIVEALSLDSADTAVARNYSNFLIELASIAPKLMIPHLSTLGEELLNCESHMLRNCILQIMGDAIVGELTSEDLSEELKEARNEFLESLLAHINDVSAHVRAKVLQIWQHMKEENAVPLSFQLQVLRGAVERLEDKTSTVRKSAVQLVKAFLERNPFAPKLSLEELQKKHDEAVQQMEILTQRVEEERQQAEQLHAQWDQLVPQILPLVVDDLRENTVVEINSEQTYEHMIERVSILLVEKKYKEAVKLVRQADSVAGTSEMRSALKSEEQCMYYLALLKSYLFLAQGTKDSNEELGTQIKTVQFLQDSIEFSKVIARGVPKLQELLLSKTNSDTCEAVDLFTTGYLFGIKGMEAGMQLMLQLVWSSDKEKRDAVSNAYKKMLFDTQETGRMHAIKVVQNLSRFLRSLEYGHYTALEVLVREWVSTDDIDAIIVQVLFERFTLKLEGTTEDDARLALQLLIMASQEKNSIAKANLSIIESIALGERGKRDPRLFTSCLEFMINSLETGSNKYHKRYEADSTLVQQILQQLRVFYFYPRLPDFDRLGMRTLEFVYHMCQSPDIICQRLLQDILRKMRGFTVKLQLTETPPATQDCVPDSQPLSNSQMNNTQQQKLLMPAFLLSRLMFLIGYMTLKELIFLDIDVYNNMKYRQELAECEQQKRHQAQHKQLHKVIEKTPSRRSVNRSATETLKLLSASAAEPQQEPDEDLVGATAEDNIAELINHICEEVLLYNEGALLSKLFPYIKEICKYPAKFADTNLQQAATLALVRCMCVSSRCCEHNMPFLMNILGHTRNTRIKCNIIIGLTDLTFRFPNIIEPWTGHFYNTLHEEDTELRLTTVKMLAHLILHEMIRVKGQIADLALCLVDKNDEIRHRTQQFFKEIANKSNILYNVLPDIISKLSNTSLKLEEEKYRVIMRHILGLIQKDRQVETLVEKLCLRFGVTREERQWRDVAYCLTLLTYNERCIKKLTDYLQSFRDKLQVEEVYEAFKLIINNTNKMAKPELKTAVQEFETRLNELHSGDDNIQPPAEENNTGADGGNTQTQKPQERQRKTKRNATQGRRKVYQSDSSEEEDDDEDFVDKAKSHKSRTQSNSSPDENFESSHHGARNTTQSRNTARNHVIQQNSGSSDKDMNVEMNVSQQTRGRKKRK